jgi:hypothetical protein
VPACGGARCQQRSERVGREEGGGERELEPDTIGLIPPISPIFGAGVGRRWKGADDSGHGRAIRCGGRHRRRGIRRKTRERREGRRTDGDEAGKRNGNGGGRESERQRGVLVAGATVGRWRLTSRGLQRTMETNSIKLVISHNSSVPIGSR